MLNLIREFSVENLFFGWQKFQTQWIMTVSYTHLTLPTKLEV